MRDEDDGRGGQQIGMSHAEEAIEHFPGRAGVQSAERVVEQYHVWSGIHCPRQRHPLLLATAERYAPLANLGHVAGRELFEVRPQAAGI